MVIKRVLIKRVQCRGHRTFELETYISTNTRHC
jgi:hypothetical protein